MKLLFFNANFFNANRNNTYGARKHVVVLIPPISIPSFINLLCLPNVASLQFLQDASKHSARDGKERKNEGNQSCKTKINQGII